MPECYNCAFYSANSPNSEWGRCHLGPKPVPVHAILSDFYSGKCKAFLQGTYSGSSVTVPEARTVNIYVYRRSDGNANAEVLASSVDPARFRQVEKTP